MQGATTPTHTLREITWQQVWTHRLRRHSLLERAPAERLVEVVGAVCGIHAQMMPAAEVSIGVRVDVTRGDIRAALWDTRGLVKTYGVRGTIHLFPSHELPLWMAANRARAARAAAIEAKRLDYLGLTPEQVTALLHGISAALDGRVLTLRELGEEVMRRTGAWAAESANEAWVRGWPNWRTALGTAAMEGVLCFGPNRGNEVTFVRPDQWLRGWQPADPEAALREVFRRFLSAYGPATTRDFAQWFHLPPPAARELADSMRAQLLEVLIVGKRTPLWAVEVLSDEDAGARSVRLLPHFDCYLRGCHPREQLVGVYAPRAAGGTGQFPILLIDGRVAGVWERRQRGSRVEIRVEPFQRLLASQKRALVKEAERVGEVLESKAELVIGSVEVRAHL